MKPVTVEDMRVVKPVPPTPQFEEKAQWAADLATEYVNNLPIGGDQDRAVQAHAGAVLLACAMYDVNDGRTYNPEEVFTPGGSAFDANVSRLLEVGYSQRPVVA
jgi:hypothetical protein